MLREILAEKDIKDLVGDFCEIEEIGNAFIHLTYFKILALEITILKEGNRLTSKKQNLSVTS